MYSCKRCNGDYFLYRASTEQAYENGGYLTKQCYSNCPEGTWVRGDGSRECVSCGARCEKCLSYSQCTECDHGYQLINGYCSSYCPSGKYQTSSGCYSCSSACKSCSNSTFCTSCLAGYSLFYSSTYQTLTCLTSCPSTYYADPSGWCLKCPSLCVTCTDASTCIQCVNGIPPTNGVCYNSTNTTCVDKCEICRYGVCERCSVPFALYRNGGTGVSSCVSACPAGYYLSGFNC
jgi:proprotein convertase subtilisin/kexin type 5